MRISLTQREANMLIDAANRMECDDVWDSEGEGGQYSEADFDALVSGATKLATSAAAQKTRKAVERD